MLKKSLFLIMLFGICAAFGQTTVDTLFFDDFESGSLAMEPFICPAEWHTSPTGAYSGKSWWCGNETIGGYSNCWYQILTSPEISLPSSPSGELKLSFFIDMSIEPPPATPSDEGGIYVDGWDGFHIVISTDGGDTWELLVPSDGYDCDTMFGFVHANDSILAGWGGSTGGWTHKEASLDGYAGEDVEIRFVFAADPFFDTRSDSAMFGVKLDDIAVSDDAATYFYDDAEDSIASPMTTEDTRPDPMPIISDERAYSPSHSMFAQSGHLTTISVVTPSIDIEDGFLAMGSYHIFRDTPDNDDYYVIYISTDDGVSWLPLGTDRNWDTDWQFISGSSGLDNPYPGMIFYDYIGSDIKLKLTFIYDNDDAAVSGDGIFIDDFCISGIFGNTYDAGVSNIFAGPVNVNQDIIFNIEVTGYGISEISPTVYYKIFDSGDALVTSGFLGSVDVALNRRQYASFIWRPTEPGDYYVLAWTTSAFDEDGSNDSLIFDFSVPNENHRELGYDDAVQDSFYSSSAGRYYYYVVPGFDSFDEIGDGYAVDFELPFDYATLDSIKILGKGEGNITFGIFDYDGGMPASTPDITFSTSLHEGGIDGEWFEYTPDEPYEIPFHDYIVAVWAADTESFFWAGIDNSAPYDHRSWRIDPEGAYYAFQNMTELSAPYADFDFIVRCCITQTNGIEESKVPQNISLLQNTPNPFNSFTAIEFDLSEVSDISIAIYDISGKSIRHLSSGHYSPGVHRIIWDGKNDGGENAPSGIYIVKLYSGKTALKRNIVLVK